MVPKVRTLHIHNKLIAVRKSKNFNRKCPQIYEKWEVRHIISNDENQRVVGLQC